MRGGSVGSQCVAGTCEVWIGRIRRACWRAADDCAADWHAGFRPACRLTCCWSLRAGPRNGEHLEFVWRARGAGRGLGADEGIYTGTLSERLQKASGNMRACAWGSWVGVRARWRCTGIHGVEGVHKGLG